MCTWSKLLRHGSVNRNDFITSWTTNPATLMLLLTTANAGACGRVFFRGPPPKNRVVLLPLLVTPRKKNKQRSVPSENRGGGGKPKKHETPDRPAGRWPPAAGATTASPRALCRRKGRLGPVDHHDGGGDHALRGLLQRHTLEHQAVAPTRLGVALRGTPSHSFLQAQKGALLVQASWKSRVGFASSPLEGRNWFEHPVSKSGSMLLAMV